jgi:hypothetical protein
MPLSGCCALSLEIVWFRLLDVTVKSTAFTFGTVLAVYLTGSAAGSLWGVFRVGRIQHPLRAFLLCQTLLLSYAGATVWLLARVPVTSPIYASFFEYWGRYDGGVSLGLSADPTLAFSLYCLLPLLLFGPPTVLMGLSFPILHRAVQDDPRTSGKKAGTLQAANIAGCVVGSLGVGLVSLRLLGSTGTLQVLMGIGVLFAILGLRQGGSRVFALLATVLVVLLLGMPSRERLWARLHGMAEPPILAVEDATGVVAFVPREEKKWALFINGKGNSVVPSPAPTPCWGRFPRWCTPTRRTSP